MTTRTKEGCAFCGLVERRREEGWILDHGDGDGIISFKPLGATVEGHRLFVPYEHLQDAATDPDVTGLCFQLAARWGREHGPDFNLVVNSGRQAGQTVFHLHVHYVPRRVGDGKGYRWREDGTE